MYIENELDFDFKSENEEDINKKRDRAYYRYQRNRTINKKLRKIKSVWSEDSLENIQKNKGKLSKGKIHCSCPMCSAKSRYELKASDKRKLSRIIEEIKEFEIEDIE